MDTIKDVATTLQVTQILHELFIVLVRYNMFFDQFYNMNLEDKRAFLQKVNQLKPDDFFNINYFYQLLIDLNFIQDEL